jgi:protein tyrosine/serine phosphatase
MGLTSVVDLRTSTEVERDGRGRLMDEPVHYINLSVLPEEGGESQAAPAPEGDDIGERYLWYLEAGGASLATALQLVADGDGHPLVFHCTAGKDRTGVLSALVLSCLRVVPSAIVDDYVQTASRLDLIVERLRRHPVYGKNIAEVPQARFRVEAIAMERFLAGVGERYGGAAQWALTNGVPAEALDGLSRCLLEDDERQGPAGCRPGT